MNLGETARAIFMSALAECDIENAFRRKSEVDRGTASYRFTLQGGLDEPAVSVDLGAFDRILVIAVGKASGTMLRGLLSTLPIPPQARLDGVLISPDADEEIPYTFQHFAGGHPEPNEASFAGARTVIEMLREAARRKEVERTFCFFLVSGGASTMMEMPLDSRVALPDMVHFHQTLVHCGAPISEINCVRKHISAVKGGRLGEIVAHIPNLTILVSDVPLSQYDALGSGPTIPDSTTVEQCLSIVERYNLIERFTAPVRTIFVPTRLRETPKPGAYRAAVSTLLAAEDLAEAARRAAESCGFDTHVDLTCDDWDYRLAADYLLEKFRTLRKSGTPVCLISVGEISVSISSDDGRKMCGVGGRNQHFVLYVATQVRREDHSIAILSAASDGIDGNSPFAGAVVDDVTLELLRSGEGPEGVTMSEAVAALDGFDASTVLRRLHATIETGPTGNNLRDLRILLG